MPDSVNRKAIRAALAEYLDECTKKGEEPASETLAGWEELLDLAEAGQRCARVHGL